MENQEITGPHSQAGIIVEERMRPATVALNVWASCQFHQMAGGDGWPTYEECLLYVEDPQGPDSRVFEDASRFYDETRDKFVRRAGLPPQDRRTLSCVEVVERVIVSVTAPMPLVRFLLFVHPEYGRYAPRRPAAPPSLNDYQAFVHLGLARELQGRLVDKHTNRHAASLVRSLHLGFLSDLRRACRKGPYLTVPRVEPLHPEPVWARDADPPYEAAG